MAHIGEQERRDVGLRFCVSGFCDHVDGEVHLAGALALEEVQSVVPVMYNRRFTRALAGGGLPTREEPLLPRRTRRITGRSLHSAQERRLRYLGRRIGYVSGRLGVMLSWPTTVIRHRLALDILKVERRDRAADHVRVCWDRQGRVCHGRG